MRNSFLLSVCLVVLAGCSKKTVPAGRIAAPQPAIASSFSAPMVVIDEKGTVITSKDQLPQTIADKVDYNLIARSYTPVQRTHLIYRFKMVPPRVLFIPMELATKSSRGYYCIYKKKFWYWQKQDGLFYLDETYYR